MKPQICVLKTDGTNCDEETAFAFAEAGADAHIVHVNELKNGARRLRDFHILALPGGFSYGDDVVSGKILAVELLSFLKDQLLEFVEARKLVLGICNGFQVLVRTGLIPAGRLGSMTATLTNNDSGKFHCRWVELQLTGHFSPWTAHMGTQSITLPMAHGEGKFFAQPAVLRAMVENEQIIVRYKCNPNGSLYDIAGACDPSGRILGLMPHPERFVMRHQYPNWRRHRLPPHGLEIFRGGVQYAVHNLL